MLTLWLVPQTLSAQPIRAGAGRLAQKNLMKDWALSICFARITQDAQTKKDAGATARAYLENSRQSVEEFAEIGQLIDRYIALKYEGSDESSYNTMKCIDLFHSKELDKLSEKFVKAG